MNLIEKVFITFTLGILAFVGVGFHSSNDYNSTLESTYGVKVVTMEGHLLSQSRVVVERDGQKLRCDTPSRDEMKIKTPMNCDETLKISAKA
jgi:hypothetical protein